MSCSGSGHPGGRREEGKETGRIEESVETDAGSRDETIANGRAVFVCRKRAVGPGRIDGSNGA